MGRRIRKNTLKRLEQVYNQPVPSKETKKKKKSEDNSDSGDNSTYHSYLSNPQHIGGSISYPFSLIGTCGSAVSSHYISNGEINFQVED